MSEPSGAHAAPTAGSASEPSQHVPGDPARPPRGMEFVTGDAIVIRPSLRAAFDVLGKLAGALALFGLPFWVGLAVQGNPKGLREIATIVAGGGLGLFYGVLAAFGPLVQLAFTQYVIEPDGIRVRTQILSKSERRVQWEKVTMLRHRRTLIDRFFGIDRLDVVAHGARGTTLHLVGLRDATRLRDHAARKMRACAAVGGRFGDD